MAKMTKEELIGKALDLLDNMDNEIKVSEVLETLAGSLTSDQVQEADESLNELVPLRRFKVIFGVDVELKTDSDYPNTKDLVAKVVENFEESSSTFEQWFNEHFIEHWRIGGK